MTLPEAMAARPQAPVRLEVLPRPLLEALLEAGREVLEWRRVLAKTGENVVGLVLEREGPFYILDHYPKGDVYDPESHAQWYYHAHDKAERPGEHGHFHTFLRGPGMPAGVRPAPGPGIASKPADLVCHLIAISMDRSGWPIKLFTTNRWVTGETWYAAHDVAAMLGGFEMKINKPSWPVNRWLTAMLRLFRPEIERLLQERDARIAEWRERHPEVAEVFEDRRLEVTSELAIDVEDQVRALEAALARA
jgi:hypothetical protein